MRSYAVSGGQLRRPTESAQILWILPTQFCRRLARGPLELRDLLPASSNFLADQNALIRSRPLLIAACSAFGAEMRLLESELDRHQPLVELSDEACERHR